MKPVQNPAAWKDGAPHNHFQLQPQTPTPEEFEPPSPPSKKSLKKE